MKKSKKNFVKEGLSCAAVVLTVIAVLPIKSLAIVTVIIGGVGVLHEIFYGRDVSSE